MKILMIYLFQNVLRQSLQLIAKILLIAVYAYQAYRHSKLDGTLLIKKSEKKITP